MKNKYFPSPAESDFDEYLPTMQKQSHKGSEPVDPPSDSAVRALTDEEIERLKRRLGRPVDHPFLVHWVSVSIRDLVRLSVQPTARDCRDSLMRIAEKGRDWLDHLDGCPGISLLGFAADEARSTVAKFCGQVDLLANKLDSAVKPGHPRTPFALEAFIDRMIGIAKTAKVYPSAEGRALRSQTAPRDPPDFFQFVVEALQVAEDVILSSPLAEDRKQAALSALSIQNDAVLSRLIVRLRGKISDYREGERGLVTWPVADSND